VSTKELWHLRYVHLNPKDLVLLQGKHMVKILLVFKNEHVECDGCALGKQHRNEFPMRTDEWKIIFFELVHIDVCGQMETKSIGGASYFLIFIDDRTKFTWVYFIRKKRYFF
jgi:hypothetical protein